MKILLDRCVPKRLKRLFPDHQVSTTREMRWEALQNGALLDQAQQQFDILLTVDQNIEHQQNLAGRSIAIVILVAFRNAPETLAMLVPAATALLPTVESGKFYRVTGPETPDAEA